MCEAAQAVYREHKKRHREAVKKMCGRDDVIGGTLEIIFDDCLEVWRAEIADFSWQYEHPIFHLDKARFCHSGCWTFRKRDNLALSCQSPHETYVGPYEHQGLILVFLSIDFRRWAVYPKGGRERDNLPLWRTQ